MFNRLILICLFSLSITAAQNAEASFPFNLPTLNVSYKPCFDNTGVYAAAMEWSYCPTWKQVHNIEYSDVIYVKQRFKVCKHNTDVYDVRNSDGTCHFEENTSAPNLKLKLLHEKTDGGHDCDLDEDEDDLYIGLGGNVM